LRVHLVDGTYELFRCFHGAPRAEGAGGREVGAARAMFATFAALLAEPATHVAVAFDRVVASPPASAGKGAEALLDAQVPLAAEVIRALGIVVWPSGRFQADELLASGATRFAADPRVEQVVICTTDLDLAQCVRGTRVVVLDRSRRRISDEDAVRARFGVAPPQLPSLFALVGDRSDGIAGVPGWGLRSAAALVAAYGDVGAIPADPSTWTVAVRGAARLGAALASRRREALHAEALLTLRDDAPLVESGVDDLMWHGADPRAVDTLLDVLAAPELRERVTRWAPG
jgi:5'-3' exonuclease